ncbi:hypothetical protein [Brevundimonas sp. SORGH_AS_0993]|uniref:hypothetical protein n=1 Tax=Brevundimonas sp. SORGH_AS_0993 TaxID=3041794 RepID=UPI0027817865|nr:hypothetical protein [Brevundimonas sp. SORGH_AS_0993]MDQ1153742.1 hypothetical protein [Brevundimonas sp. SORGH_AS_0993]
MRRPRAPKKSETVEIRLSHPIKTAFMARCRAEGRTASDAIRQFIEAELDGAARRPTKTLSGWRALIAAAGAGLALGAVAAPSLAQSSLAQSSLVHSSYQSKGADAERFARLDRNHDGVLSRDEYLAR